MRWPWQRPEERKTDAAPRGAAAPGAVRTVPPAGWAFLPPLQRQISDAAPAALRPAFVASLPTRAVPASLGAMGHLVDTDAPSGTISLDGGGLAAPVQRTVAAELSLRHPVATPTTARRQTHPQEAAPDAPLQRDVLSVADAGAAETPAQQEDPGAVPVGEAPRALNGQEEPPDISAQAAERTAGDTPGAPLPTAPEGAAARVVARSATPVDAPVASPPAVPSVQRRAASERPSSTDHQWVLPVGRPGSIEPPPATAVQRQSGPGSPRHSAPAGAAPAGMSVQRRPGLGAPLPPAVPKEPATLPAAPLDAPSRGEARVTSDVSTPREAPALPLAGTPVNVPIVPTEVATAAAEAPGAAESPVVQRDVGGAAMPRAFDTATLATTTWQARLTSPLPARGPGIHPEQLPATVAQRTVPIVAARVINPAIAPRPLGAATRSAAANRVVAARVVPPGEPDRTTWLQRTMRHPTGFSGTDPQTASSTAAAVTPADLGDAAPEALAAYPLADTSAAAATWIPGPAPTARIESSAAALPPVQRAFGAPRSLPSLPSAPALPPRPDLPMPAIPSAPDLSSLGSRIPDVPSPDELRTRAAEVMPEAADAARSASDTLTEAAQALSPPAGGAAASENVEHLVRKLYGPLVRRIKAELLLDRERRGIRIDGI